MTDEARFVHRTVCAKPKGWVVLLSLREMRLRRPTTISRVACRTVTCKLIASAFFFAPVVLLMAAKPAAAQSVAFVRNERAFLRAKPSTESDVKATLEQGRTARVVERKGDWVRLKLASGNEGWVREDLLAVSQSLAQKRAKVLAVREEVRRAKRQVAQEKAQNLAEQKAAKNSVKPSETVEINDSDIEHQRLFEAKVNSAVAGVLRSIKTPQKQAAAIVTPVEADPRFASAPVASSITMELETSKAEAAPLSPAPDTDVPNTDVAPQPMADDKPIINRESNSRSDRLVRTALASRGTPYRFGATGRGAFDCSSFVQYIYNKNGVGLPRTAAEQYQRGTPVPKSQLQTGDLVFFKNTYKHGVSHVGMYVGEGYFVHASSGAHEVTVSRLDGSYYQNHWAGARRPAK